MRKIIPYIISVLLMIQPVLADYSTKNELRMVRLFFWVIIIVGYIIYKVSKNSDEKPTRKTNKTKKTKRKNDNWF